MKEIIHDSWQTILSAEFEKPYYQELREFLKKGYQTQTIYPDMYYLFSTLELTPFKEVKVVILRQNPYHGPSQAHGLSSSVQPGVKVPPSLANIYRELQAGLGYQPVNHGFLENQAKQGVLLLSTVLIIRANQTYSHQDKGWEQLTDVIIGELNKCEKPVVFILWGRPAQEKIKMIGTTRHVIIKSPHPSPLSAHRGFFDSRPFSQANAALERLRETPIDWQLPETM